MPHTYYPYYDFTYVCIPSKYAYSYSMRYQRSGTCMMTASPGYEVTKSVLVRNVPHHPNRHGQSFPIPFPPMSSSYPSQSVHERVSPPSVSRPPSSPSSLGGASLRQQACPSYPRTRKQLCHPHELFQRLIRLRGAPQILVQSLPTSVPVILRRHARESG